MSQEEAAKNKSVTELLTDVKNKHDRLLRNRVAAHQEISKIPIEEKLLENAIKQLEYYTKSVNDLTKSLEIRRKRLQFALDYCKQHAEDYEKLKMAEDLAKKIARLQKQVEEKKLQLANDMTSVSTDTPNIAPQ